jgi:cation:H+ antiporter
MQCTCVSAVCYDEIMTHIGLLGLFGLAMVVTWVAGIWLTRATDAIDSKYKLGSAFGGLLILGIATSLPEIAIVVAAAIQHHYGMIIGTLIGGIAIQTAVLAILDARMKPRHPLTFSAASLTLVLEAAVVILVTTAALMAIRTPLVVPHTHLSLTSLFILALWLFGLWLVHRSRKGLPWKAEALHSTPGRLHKDRRAVINHPALRGGSTTKIFVIFGLAALVTLVAGVVLEEIGSNLATAYHINSGIFAATVIAFTGALPNISTGIGSIDLGDYQLAMSDIFGGNAFLPALFVVCDLITGNAVLRNATSNDIWFAALGVLLTTIYLIGLIVRPRRKHWRLGVDSLCVVALYIAGIVALTASSG